jgi:uncharacterized protein YgiB involved in biofilm formation
MQGFVLGKVVNSSTSFAHLVVFLYNKNQSKLNARSKNGQRSKRGGD